MNDLQILASDPNYSVWVSASAGTGKTKILTDRVLRLLINGTAFNKILCLTFTNAAATEMQVRINYRLAEWAISDTNKLKNDLNILLGRIPSNSEVKYAKALYNKLLSTQDKISINTIHSFCLKILKRFPLESAINPGFQILDNIKEREIIVKIKRQIYLDPASESLINFFVANFHEITINDIFNEIIQQKLKFKKLFSLEDYEKNSAWPVSLPYTYENIKQEFDKLSQNFNFITNKHGDLSKEDKFFSFFLTKDGNRRQRLLPKELATKYPELLIGLYKIQEQVYQFEQAKRIEEMLQYSDLLANLAKVFIEKYEAYKKEYSLLDYDDLIYLARSLLTKAHAKEWVLYKLDGGIDHLLVDEAQDTSPEQWEIIAALIEEFYSGEGSNNFNRTIFVVGDEKQSIFSFQGADITSFNLMNDQLTQKLTNANKDLKIINLEISYRSLETILTVVYDIFERIKNTNQGLFKAVNIKIQPFRKMHPGKVELWPIIKAKKPSHLFWPLPYEHDLINPPEKQLAVKIACFIKEQIDNKVILPSTGLPAKFADFMILVRTRDELITEIINQLKNYALDVVGIDRMVLNQNLSVMDLISAAKFVLAPQDDLNLCCLLKSPIIGLSETSLQRLTIGRLDSSIWELLKEYIQFEYEEEYVKVYNLLMTLLDIYANSNIGNFFHIVVDRMDLRASLIIANGYDSNDAINELLYLSNNYINNIDSSLQSFIYWFESNNIEVKRDVGLSDKIQVMTVHASKGLQAPVVILCDTTSIPINRNKFTWTDDGRLISSMQTSNSPQFLKDLKAKEQEKDLQEYLRLLYVAMTRASDHLIICGYQSNELLPVNCWYELVYKSMLDLAGINQDGIMTYGDYNFETGEAQSALELGASIESSSNIDSNKHLLPNMQKHIFAAGAANIIDIKKTVNINGKNSTVSPFKTREYLEYGRIFHKILEDTFKTKDLSKLSLHPLIKTLEPKLQDKIYNSITNLLGNKEFVEIANQEIKTEVNIGLTQGGLIKIGRIDLLIIGPQHLTIVDYKSDASPTQKSLIPANYLDQLNFYRHIMQKIYPEYKILCKILWLENGQFMTI